MSTTDAVPVLELRDAVIGYDGQAVVSDASFAVAAGRGGRRARGERLGQVHAGPRDPRAGRAPRRIDRRVRRAGRRASIGGGGSGTCPSATRWRPGSRRPSPRSSPRADSRRHRPWRRLGATDRERVQAAIRLVGLSGRERDPVAELSGGQQRRVLIARALAGDAELLLLDEPTAGVDAQNQVALAETMQHLVDDGVTILLVAHELGPAAAVVTRSIVVARWSDHVRRAASRGAPARPRHRPPPPR